MSCQEAHIYGSQSGIPGAAVAAAPETLLQMQVLSQTLVWVGLGICVPGDPDVPTIWEALS